MWIPQKGEKIRYIGPARGTFTPKKDPQTFLSIGDVVEVSETHIHADGTRLAVAYIAPGCKSSTSWVVHKENVQVSNIIYFEPLNKAVVIETQPQLHECKCDIITLMKDGCTCGAIQRHVPLFGRQ